MPDPLVITNTSPLLYLHQTGYLDVLRQLYGSIAIPSAVRKELEEGKQQGFDVPEVGSFAWVHVRQATSTANVPTIAGLGNGEAEVIALGLETDNHLLILDDRLARQIADSYGLRYTGTLGVLMKAKQNGLIPLISDVVHLLRAKGMWLSDEIVDTVLKLAGEKSEQ